MMMPRTSTGLYYGSTPGTAGSLLTRFPQHIPGFQYAVIRCLDSDSNPLSILRSMQQKDIEANHVDCGVHLNPVQLLYAANELIFTGFDEIWLFDTSMRTVHVPAELALTSDAVNLDSGIPDNLEQLMADSSCVLALGDGCGLNYATWNSDFASFVVTHQQL